MMKLEDLRVYKSSMELGEEIWKIVHKWDFFAKDTIGKQLVRAADSIASNLSEGFGRYHFKDTKNFGYYSRGSLFETKTWLTKAHSRNLISDEEFEHFVNVINEIGIKLNNYLNAIGNDARSANDAAGK